MRLQRIKKLTPELATQIRIAHSTCFPRDKPFTPKEGQWWILWDGPIVAAFCGIRASAWWNDCGYLSRAGVLPQYRGKGIQKKLIRLRCAYAKKQGWSWVVTDTRDNPASSNSLIACGFRMYRPSNPWSFKDACYWRRKIT